jgi:16S rRNA G966 N2-methylase RsmD
VEFVERAPAALKVLRGNLERLGLTAGFRIHAAAVGAFLRRAGAAKQNQNGYEVVFLDPPWDAARSTRPRWACWAAPRRAARSRARW